MSRANLPNRAPARNQNHPSQTLAVQPDTAFSGLLSWKRPPSEKATSSIGATGFEPAAFWSQTKPGANLKGESESPVAKNRREIPSQNDIGSASADNRTGTGQRADRCQVAITENAPHVNNRSCTVACERCGITYTLTRYRPERAKRRLCKTCRGTVAAGLVHAKYTTPESDKAQRIRANGLINKRLRLGWFTKPKFCMKCGDVPRKMEGHHTDYTKPDHVHWLCHGCHQTAHLRPDYLNGIAPFVCDDKRTADQKPKAHGKGGWFGPRTPEEMAKRHYKPATKIPDADVQGIRRAVNAGQRQVDVAARFGVSQFTVSRIYRGKQRASCPRAESEVRP